MIYALVACRHDDSVRIALINVTDGDIRCVAVLAHFVTVDIPVIPAGDTYRFTLARTADGGLAMAHHDTGPMMLENLLCGMDVGLEPECRQHRSCRGWRPRPDVHLFSRRGPPRLQCSVTGSPASYQRTMPASAVRAWPVIQCASSDARKAMAGTMSPGTPRPLIACSMSTNSKALT